MPSSTQNDRLGESFPTARGACPAHAYTHACTHVFTHAYTHACAALVALATPNIDIADGVSIARVWACRYSK